MRVLLGGGRGGERFCRDSRWSRFSGGRLLDTHPYAEARKVLACATYHSDDPIIYCTRFLYSHQSPNGDIASRAGVVRYKRGGSRIHLFRTAIVGTWVHSRSLLSSVALVVAKNAMLPVHRPWYSRYIPYVTYSNCGNARYYCLW